MAREQHRTKLHSAGGVGLAATMSANPAAVMLYRSLLRWTRSTPVKDAAFDLPLLDSALESRWPTTPVCSAAGVAAAVRSAFREEVADPEAGVAQAFVLLRSLQGYTQHIEELAKQRADHSDRAGVAYSVGEVLRHKQFAFRGVVMGWDRRPVTDVAHWDGMAGVTTEQPFYHVLPDTADCLAFLGGPREWRYVAESNLAPREISATERRVSSPFLKRFFTNFDPVTGRFLPQDSHRYLYPDPVYDTAESPVAQPDDLAAAAALQAAEARVTAVVASVAQAAMEPLAAVPSLEEETAELSDALAKLQQHNSENRSEEERGMMIGIGGWSPSDDEAGVVAPALWQLRDLISRLRSAAHRREQTAMAYDLDFVVGDVVWHQKCATCPYLFCGCAQTHDAVQM